MTLANGVAAKGERLRIIKRAVRQQMTKGGYIRTEKDVLDWLKQAHKETSEQQGSVQLNVLALPDSLNLVYGVDKEYPADEAETGDTQD